MVDADWNNYGFNAQDAGRLLAPETISVEIAGPEQLGFK